MTMSKAAVFLCLVALVGSPVHAGGAHHHGQGGPPGAGAGPGWRGGPGHGQGGGHADMPTIHALFANREQIRRVVTEIPKGVETVTESEDPEVAALIRSHVEAMHRRLLEGRPIHARDPLFAQIFRHRQAITMKTEPTATGIKVTETSEDPYVVKLIRAHAAVVTRFLSEGRREMMRNHEPPPRD